MLIDYFQFLLYSNVDFLKLSKEKLKTQTTKFQPNKVKS